VRAGVQFVDKFYSTFKFGVNDILFRISEPVSQCHSSTASVFLSDDIIVLGVINFLRLNVRISAEWFTPNQSSLSVMVEVVELSSCGGPKGR
jgi:hypothetical protein